MVHEAKSDWLEKGLYWEEYGGENKEPVKHPLDIRIGLHTGPVVMHYDPLVRRLIFSGARVNRAAQIEPVAETGEIFASENLRRWQNWVPRSSGASPTKAAPIVPMQGPGSFANTPAQCN
jgi:hypothetical protein